MQEMMRNSRGLGLVAFVPICEVVFCVESIKQGRKRFCKDASCLDLGRGERI